MKKLFFILLFASTSVLAINSNPLFTWTAPTAYTDGTPVQTGEIDGYRIYCDQESIVLNVTGEVEEYRAPSGSFSIGSHSCYMTAIARGVESVPSDTVPFDVDPAAPGAVINFSVAK